MFGIGMPELILILAVALIVIGPKKLPDLAKSLGRAFSEFKKATSDFKDAMDFEEMRDLKKSYNDMNAEIKDAIDVKPKIKKALIQDSDTAHTADAPEFEPHAVPGDMALERKEAEQTAPPDEERAEASKDDAAEDEPADEPAADDPASAPPETDSEPHAADAEASEDEFAESSAYELRPCSMAVFRMGTEKDD